jgi:GxxExxY protein
MLHEHVTGRVIKAAFDVHGALGAGRLESAYHACLCHQLAIDGLTFEHQIRLPIKYRGTTVDTGYRLDFVVENCVVVELKAVERLLAIHTAQVITYLKLSGHPVGLLINFNVVHLLNGSKRVVKGNGAPI